MKEIKKAPVLALILGILLILSSFATVFLAYQNMILRKEISSVAVFPTPTFQTDTSNWKTYTNTKHGYSIKYPGDWAFREFPDTKDGASFYNVAQGDKVGSELIGIDFREGGRVGLNMSFADYVKVAATHEIQNFQSLSTITPITTQLGVLGYITTWNVLPIMGGGSVTVSGPITYFDSKLPTGETIQVSGDNTNDIIYNEMLSTFQLTN